MQFNNPNYSMVEAEHVYDLTSHGGSSANKKAFVGDYSSLWPSTA